MYTIDASVWGNAFDQREPGHLVSRRFLNVVHVQALPVIVPNLALIEWPGRLAERAVLLRRRKRSPSR